MELGIGFVCHFPVQPLAKFRHIREQADQLYIVGIKNGAAHSSITLDHSVFIITVTAGVPVSDVLGNGLQHDGLVSLMQLPEGGNGLLRHILPQNIGRFRVGRLGLQGIFFGQSLFRLDFVELLLFLFGEIAALLNQIGDPLGNLLPCEMHIRAAAFCSAGPFRHDLPSCPQRLTGHGSGPQCRTRVGGNPPFLYRCGNFGNRQKCGLCHQKHRFLWSWRRRSRPR